MKCKICNGVLPKRFSKFCSKKCRTRNETIKYREQRNEWHREKSGRYAPNKKKCIICSKWYVQVGSHIAQRHDMSAREYREEFGLPVKRGITPGWYRELKGNQALQNKTFLNLKVGKKYWYKKGDKRTKVAIFFKSRKYKPDEYYE